MTHFFAFSSLPLWLIQSFESWHLIILLGQIIYISIRYTILIHVKWCNTFKVWIIIKFEVMLCTRYIRTIELKKYSYFHKYTRYKSCNNTMKVFIFMRRKYGVQGIPYEVFITKNIVWQHLWHRPSILKINVYIKLYFSQPMKLLRFISQSHLTVRG